MIDPSRGWHLVLLAGFEGDQRVQVIAEHLGGSVSMTSPSPRRVFETIFMVAVKMRARVGLADGAIVSRYIRICRLSSAK